MTGHRETFIIDGAGWRATIIVVGALYLLAGSAIGGLVMWVVLR